MPIFLNAVTIAVGIATVLGVGMLIPQTLSMLRTRNFHGVSAAWIGGGIAINSGWLVYALWVGILGLIPVSLGSLALYVAMGVMFARHGRSEFPRVLASCGLVTTLFIVAALVGGGIAVFGFAIALTYSAQFGPAAWSALFSSNVSGISAITWVMALIEAVIWALYGASLGDAALLFGGTGAGIMSTLVLVGVMRNRRRKAPLGAPKAKKTRNAHPHPV